MLPPLGKLCECNVHWLNTDHMCNFKWHWWNLFAFYKICAKGFSTALAKGLIIEQTILEWQRMPLVANCEPYLFCNSLTGKKSRHNCFYSKQLLHMSLFSDLCCMLYWGQVFFNKNCLLIWGTQPLFFSEHAYTSNIEQLSPQRLKSKVHTFAKSSVLLFFTGLHHV